MMIHDLDPPALFPYKAAPMLEVRLAFQALVAKAAALAAQHPLGG
jgi:hypothetical protein